MFFDTKICDPKCLLRKIVVVVVVVRVVLALIFVVIIFQISLTTKIFDPKTDFFWKFFQLLKDVDTIKCWVKWIKVYKKFGPQKFVDPKKCCPKRFVKIRSLTAEIFLMDKCCQKSFGLKNCCVQKNLGEAKYWAKKLRLWNNWAKKVCSKLGQ